MVVTISRYARHVSRQGAWCESQIRDLVPLYCTPVYTEWTERIYIGICVTVHGNKCQRCVGFNTFLEGKNTQIYITLFNPMLEKTLTKLACSKFFILTSHQTAEPPDIWFWINVYLTVNKRTWRVRQGHFEVLYIPVIDIQKKVKKWREESLGDVLLNIYWCG